MVPAEAPRLVVLVVVDEPTTDVYGGLVAAPAFKEIASAAMPYLGVTPSRAPAPKPAAPALAAAPAPKSAAPAAVVLEEPAPEGTVRVPDLVGQPGRSAVSRLLGAALEPRLSGSGVVASQQPPAGTPVARGTRVNLVLASALPNPTR